MAPESGGATDVRTVFLTRDAAAIVNNLSTTCQECLYVVDFRMVVRLSKKVQKIREIGLTFSKVLHVSRIIGTIQSASSNPGEISLRRNRAEALLRLSFAGCFVRSGQGVRTAPERAVGTHCQQVLKNQP